jgi:hypothetical protein
VSNHFVSFVYLVSFFQQQLGLFSQVFDGTDMVSMG